MLGLNGCPGAVTENPPSGLYSDTSSNSSDAKYKEETNQKGRPSATDVLVPPEDTSTGPIIAPGVPVPHPDASIAQEVIIYEDATADSNSYSGEIYSQQLLETETIPQKSIDTIINAALDTALEANTSDSYNNESGTDSYLSLETKNDSENEDSEGVVNYPDSLESLVKDEEECYSIAKNEFSSYSLESIEDSGEMLFLMVGKYSGENDCLALYDESGEAYPEICTYLYAYFFSDQPFGYFHCSGSEALGVGESLPDYCYYEIKLPATPKEIKDTATEAVWCTYNSLGWNQD